MSYELVDDHGGGADFATSGGLQELRDADIPQRLADFLDRGTLTPEEVSALIVELTGGEWDYIAEALDNLQGNVVLSNGIVEDDGVDYSFPDHKGRPGLEGGSLPRDAGGGEVRTRSRREIAQGFAASIGLPQDVAVDYGGAGYKFKVGDQEFTAAGQFNPTTETITVYDGAFSATTDGKAYVIPGVLAHEIQHAKFDKWKQQAMEERHEFYVMPRTERIQYETDNGFLNEAGKKRFPNYAAYETYGDPDYQRSLWKNDGITDYSTSYWKDFIKTGGNDSQKFERAVDETLGEVARLVMENPNTWGRDDMIAPNSPAHVWVDLYKKIGKASLAIKPPREVPSGKVALSTLYDRHRLH